MIATAKLAAGLAVALVAAVACRSQAAPSPAPAPPAVGKPAERAAPTEKAEAAPSVPKRGSPQRTAILDAVRSALKIKSEFKVNHLKTSGDWAFFEGTESARDGFESDLHVQALVGKANGGWKVEEIWTLHMDAKALDQFRSQVRKKREQHRLPDGLFPAETLAKLKEP